MFQQYLHEYLQKAPIDNHKQPDFDLAAKELISLTKPLSSKDTLKSRWEVSIRAEVLSLTEQEQTQARSQPDAFYGRMFNILDLTMLLAENECTEPGLPFNLVRELFECLSIPSCSQVFSWVERRGKRLCLDSNKGKGTGLLVLRTLNELLRNLSKSTETEFCARILVFMNDIFPLSERSGVNLRGEYGPMWEGPPDLQEGKQLILEVANKEEQKGGTKDESGDINMGEDIDPELSPEQKKTLLYKTFWFLQYPFSKPTVFSEVDMFKAFQHSVNSVLPVLSDATKKERSFAGSKALVGTKRKRDAVEDPIRLSYTTQEQHKDYAFAKYLSSPELLELEIADTNFRRQFLFQLLILLQHLRSFTEAERTKWMEPRNRSLHMDFTLSESGENWVKEISGKVMLELRSTVPEGRAFEEMIRVILEREQGWVKWKSGLCQSYEKGPVPEGVEELMQARRKDLLCPPQDWPHSHGTRELSEAWVMGYRDLMDLQMPIRIPDASELLPRIQDVEKRINMRKAQIERQINARAAQAEAMKMDGDAKTPASNPSTSLPPKPGSQPETVKPVPAKAATFESDKEKIFQKDGQIQNFERQKQTYSWLALRSASRKYLHHFSKIGTGDVAKLVFEINRASSKQEEVSEGLSEKGDMDTADVEMKTEEAKPELAEAAPPAEEITTKAEERLVRVESSSVMTIDEETPTAQGNGGSLDGAAMDVDTSIPTNPLAS